MSESPWPAPVTGDGDVRPRRRRRLVMGVVAVGLVVGGSVVGVAGIRRSEPVATVPVAVSASSVDEAVIQDRYGVRVDLLGLTALGGLVQLRFTVLDAAKATALFHDDASRPIIVVPPSGDLLLPPRSAHKMTMLNGASYFVLFPNAANAVRGGETVSLAMGDVRLDGLVVKR